MIRKVKDILQPIIVSFFGYSKYLYFISFSRILTYKMNSTEKDFRYFVSLLPDDGHILDIGANLGVLTYYLSKKRKNATIHSFEPIPYNFNNLKKVVTNYNLTNTHLYNIGLGESAAKMDMILPVVNGVKRHTLCQVYDNNCLYKEGIKFQIDIDKLDNLELFQHTENKVNAIKIDVENYEYYVFKGGANLIRTHQPLVFCELWDKENKFKVIDFFKSLGYEIKIFNNSKLEDFDSAIHLKGNFIMLPSWYKINEN